MNRNLCVTLGREVVHVRIYQSWCENFIPDISVSKKILDLGDNEIFLFKSNRSASQKSSMCENCPMTISPRNHQDSAAKASISYPISKRVPSIMLRDISDFKLCNKCVSNKLKFYLKNKKQSTNIYEFEVEVVAILQMARP